MPEVIQEQRRSREMRVKVRRLGGDSTNVLVLASNGYGSAVGRTLSRFGDVLALEPEEYRSSTSPARRTESSRSATPASDSCDTIDVALEPYLEEAGGVRACVVLLGPDRLGNRPRDVDTFQQVFESDFFLPLAAIKAVLPAMVRAKRGTIIVVLPASALVSDSRSPAACCAHWALRRVCQSLGAEVKSSNIRVHFVFASPKAAELGARLDEVREFKRLSATLAQLLTEDRQTSDFTRFRDRWRHVTEQLLPAPTDSRATAVGGHLSFTPQGSGLGNVVITGASSGLGRELARLYAGDAERLYLVGRNRAALSHLREELLRKSRCAVHIACVDLDDLRALRDYAATVDDVDMLINCAGFSVVGTVQDVRLELFRRNMTVNFFAPVLLTEAFLRRARPPRRIVNILSTTAIAGRRRQGSYSATKAALWAYTRLLQHAAPKGTRVIEILPATFASGFTTHIVNVEAGGQTAARAPKGGQSAHGLTSEIVAAKTFRATEQGRRRLFVPWKARLFQTLEAVAPRLFRRLFP